MLSAHLHLDLPSGLLPFVFLHQNSAYNSVFPHPTINMPHPSNPSWFHHFNNLRCPFSSSPCNFLHPTITGSLLSPNNFLRILFSKPLSLLRSTLNVMGQVLHTHQVTVKVMVTYILMSVFLDIHNILCKAVSSKLRIWSALNLLALAPCTGPISYLAFQTNLFLIAILHLNIYYHIKLKKITFYGWGLGWRSG